MNDGQKLEVALSLDKRNRAAIAKKAKVSRVSLNKWTKREYFTPKIINQLKAAGIDITQNGHELATEATKEQDVRVGFKRFVKVIYPENITEQEIDILLDTFKLWKKR